VLAAASVLANKEIAMKLDVCAHTAGVWRATGLPAMDWMGCTMSHVPVHHARLATA
jgi:hypothetical protein